MHHYGLEPVRKKFAESKTMATTVIENGQEHVTVRRRDIPSGPPVRMAWGAIFGGTVAALGIWALLYALGLALGLSAVDPNNPATAKASGVFTGIWGLLAPLIALFVGGAIAGRGAGYVTKGGGAIHGLVMWGLTILIGAWMLGNLVGAVMGGVASVGGEGLKAGASAMGQAAQGGGGAFGLDANAALQPINERLQSEGKPTITPDQLSAATKDALQTAVQQGRLDRETLITSIDENTALERQDAEEVAGRVNQQFEGAKDKVAGGALQVADTSGKVFWGIFGALFLGLISAVLGAIVGTSRRQSELAQITTDPAVVAHDTTGFPQQPLHQ
jgi:hypothetical protein